MAPPTADRFARLKALQRPSTPPLSGPEIGPAQSPVEEAFGGASGIATGAERLALILGASVKRNLHGEHLSLHCWHGGHAPYIPNAAALRLLAPDAPEDIADAKRWLFLDTETTGLAGGTGTYPFLVGLGWWEGGGLQVEQLFMREYSEEPSLLAALAERLAEHPVLITFNGKSFDWPLLETRYRMTRTIPPPVLLAHLDFLHPARNLWRLRLGSVRLSQLERHVLGWDRGADLASELIPGIYLDFIRGGHADALVPVFHHNQMDLRGLAGLAGRILSLLGEEEPTSPDGLELYGVSRICERRGERKRARKLYEQSIVSLLPLETDRAARAALARLARRDGDFARARELWESTLGNSREGYEAYEQLAIYFEHEAHEPRQALAIAREALAQLRRANQAGMITAAVYRKTKACFEHRLARLERKLGRTLLDAFDT
ncbi:MAG: ribonuclease H-like domain-containing protein [Candidatus Korobacteraceae bacterium]